MDTVQAQISSKKINSEIMSLSPSSLIQLFEIDLSQIALDNQIVLTAEEQTFRFHNHNKLLNTSIFWQGNEYVAAPVQAQGFEISSKGVLPVPTLSISVNDGGILALSLLKKQLRQFGDLVGAKVTRIRTFSKFLDAKNFPDNILPVGFQTDEFAEFPRDIYYVDRKVNENKNGIELQLASLLDIENVRLPGRLVIANRCTWNYRSEGCLYAGSPVATDNDQLISTLINNAPMTNRGAWNSSAVYKTGDYIYITKNNVSYYFVAKRDGASSIPPNTDDWISDQCGKITRSCRLRFGNTLPMGSFASSSRIQ